MRLKDLEKLNSYNFINPLLKVHDVKVNNRTIHIIFAHRKEPILYCTIHYRIEHFIEYIHGLDKTNAKDIIKNEILELAKNAWDLLLNDDYNYPTVDYLEHYLLQEVKKNNSIKELLQKELPELFI